MHPPHRWYNLGFLFLYACRKTSMASGSNSAAVQAAAATERQQLQQKASNARRRKAEDKMAMIFVAIVTGFLLTNFPRILLNFHEVVIFDDVMACSKLNKK